MDIKRKKPPVVDDDHRQQWLWAPPPSPPPPHVSQSSPSPLPSNDVNTRRVTLYEYTRACKLSSRSSSLYGKSSGANEHATSSSDGSSGKRSRRGVKVAVVEIVLGGAGEVQQLVLAAVQEAHTSVDVEAA
ncbi:hypothetical protein D9615_009940 [Tricholomella constricta]|uniref:Uncharacterized protein n=1 Tax=Tricholomella constricta TaxID=117010 RepID=A0A8H5H031_9AGAR|nr:hypothetical protein D9615_009940 [Tricholomella constricta]